MLHEYCIESPAFVKKKGEVSVKTSLWKKPRALELNSERSGEYRTLFYLQGRNFALYTLSGGYFKGIVEVTFIDAFPWF